MPKGGLSSFALANMAVASLQEDAKVFMPRPEIREPPPPHLAVHAPL